MALAPYPSQSPIKKTGIGSALIRAEFDWLHSQNAKGCVLIGDPNYYARFGFISDGNLSYQNLPRELVQWIGWNGHTASGILRYARGLEPA